MPIDYSKWEGVDHDDEEDYDYDDDDDDEDNPARRWLPTVEQVRKKGISGVRIVDVRIVDDAAEASAGDVKKSASSRGDVEKSASSAGEVEKDGDARKRDDEDCGGGPEAREAAAEKDVRQGLEDEDDSRPFRDPSVSDASALGNPTTRKKALDTWFRLMDSRIDDVADVECAPYAAEGSRLITVVSLGEQTEFVNDVGEPWLDDQEYHLALLRRLGSYRTMAAHRLCFIAKRFFPKIDTVEIRLCCECYEGLDEDDAIDVDPEERHLAGRVVVPVAAHPDEPLAFDRRVKVTLYDNRRKRWDGKSRRVFREEKATYRCAYCGKSHVGTMRFCASCKARDVSTAYCCDKECQRAHWEEHKKLCEKPDLTKSELIALGMASLNATPWRTLKDHFALFGINTRPDDFIQQSDGYQIRFKRRAPEDGTDEDLKKRGAADERGERELTSGARATSSFVVS